MLSINFQVRHQIKMPLGVSNSRYILCAPGVAWNVQDEVNNRSFFAFPVSSLRCDNFLGNGGQTVKLDEISGVHRLLLLTRHSCTPKYPDVHSQAQACTGSLGAGVGRLTDSPKNPSMEWSVKNINKNPSGSEWRKNHLRHKCLT